MQKNLQHFIVLEVFGPSGEAQTRGLVVPNHAFYQLNYTRIFNFCHYTTAGKKIKDFSVCGHLCGQRRFYAAFGNRGKSRKRGCYKALRRFALPCSGYRHGTPKCRALPIEPHPDIQFLLLYHAAGENQSLFLSVVIYVVKAVLLPGFVVEGNPANARVTRGSGLRLFPSWIDGATLPNQLRYSSGPSRDTKEYFQEITCPTVRVQSISMQPRDSTYLIRFPPSLQEGNLQQAL